MMRRILPIRLPAVAKVIHSYYTILPNRSTHSESPTYVHELADELTMKVRCVGKSKKFAKHVHSMWSDKVDCIGSIIVQCLCYDVLNQSKTVVRIKLSKILCCYKISYIVVITQMVDFFYYVNEH